MRRERTVTGAIALIAVVSIGIFLFTLQHALFVFQESGTPMQASVALASTVATSSLPMRLIIPSLSINASVQHVGVNLLGNMKAPNNFTDVAWYEYGTVPGDQGSAVIAGHVDNGLALDGVFKHLANLQIGNDVYIQTVDGTKLHFVVSDIEIYPYQDVPTDVLFGQKDAARLNLITCEGTWVGGRDTYDHRLVIYTQLVKNG